VYFDGMVGPWCGNGKDVVLVSQLILYIFKVYFDGMVGPWCGDGKDVF
jgi:hypothetical protein